MVNLGKNFQHETLATHETEGQSRVSHQTTRPKTPKWTKIAKEASANNTTIMGRIEIGKKKKRSQVGAAQDGSKKKSRAAAKEIESKMVEVDD